MYIVEVNITIINIYSNLVTKYFRIFFFFVILLIIITIGLGKKIFYNLVTCWQILDFPIFQPLFSTPVDC